MNKIKETIDKILNKIGFHYIGYKIYIDCIMKDIKEIRSDIKALKIAVNMQKNEFESLKNKHNKLVIDYNDNIVNLTN